MLFILFYCEITILTIDYYFSAIMIVAAFLLCLNILPENSQYSFLTSIDSQLIFKGFLVS